MLEPGPLAIAPEHFRYIKLGAGGAWEDAALEQGRIYWGTDERDHDIAVRGDWRAARAYYIERGALPSTATGWTRELRDLYSLGPDTLWITFARDHLWWAFAEPEVVLVGASTKIQGTRYRRTIGPWRKTDVFGRPLPMHVLSTKLTQLAAYRRTICAVAAADYLVRRINGIEEPAVAAARTAHAALGEANTAIIRQLHWADFELLIDLLFNQLGWRRVSALGGPMKDNDLILEQPATGERASVQVKSQADNAVLNRSLAAFNASQLSQRFFFVCHTSRGKLAPPATTVGARPVHIWGADVLGHASVNAGLSEWLMQRAA